MTQPTAPSPLAGRLCIVCAALLWSTSGAFNNFLRVPTLGLDQPKLDDMQVAAGRVFFAGLVMLPMVRPSHVRFRWVTLATVLTFAVMNAGYVSALTMGPSGVAVILQYTAPIWLFLAGVTFLGEKVERRGVVSLVAGAAGVAVILAGIVADRSATGAIKPLQVVLGIVSGITFAGVVLGLRAQRDLSASWLTAVNHLGSAVVLLPFALPWLRPDLPWPTWPQVGWLALFGMVQLGIPYALVARGLKSVSSQEAGALTLIEPLLVPVWASFVAPEKEKMSVFIFVGGALILLGLACRYWPRRADGTPRT